jgi:hypothetical protein
MAQLVARGAHNPEVTRSRRVAAIVILFANNINTTLAFELCFPTGLDQAYFWHIHDYQLRILNYWLFQIPYFLLDLVN